MKDCAIRLSSACDDEAGCKGFLSETGAFLRRKLVRRGAVDRVSVIIEFTCEKSGATLPGASISGHDVKNPECHWTVMKETSSIKLIFFTMCK